jgi:hypothetical protein
LKREVSVARAKAASYARTSKDRLQVASGLSNGETKARIKNAVKPTSVSGTLRKAGAIMMLSPDPVTDIPAAMLIGASYLAKRNDPAGLESVVRETRRMMADFQSLL